MMVVKIRKGKMKDFDVLWRILEKTPELQGDPDGDYDEDWVKDVLKNVKKDNLVLIAEIEGEFAGLVIAHYLKSVKQTLINDVFIAKKYRRKGIARKLMKECEKDARKKGNKCLTGLVLIDNKKTQNLMKKMNYKKGNKFYFYEKDLK
jgi:ribosomal protein S18 acetylase RimI-like enzyme